MTAKGGDHMTRSFESLNKLNTAEKISLRNSMGKRISSPDITDAPTVYKAFYKSDILDWDAEAAKTVNREEPYFIAACIWCAQKGNGNAELADAWRGYIEKKDSASLERRMERLLDMDFDDNFARQLADIVKMLNADKRYVDCEKLAEDLWTFMLDKQRIQRKWLGMIYKVDAKKEDDNDNANEAA